MKGEIISAKMTIIVVIALIAALIGALIWRLAAATSGDDKLKELRSREARWFEVPSEDGLTVCVWRDDADSYRCGLLPGIVAYNDPNRWNTTEGSSMGLSGGVTPEEMKLILSTYSLSKDKIAVIPWSNPYSSACMAWLTDYQLKTVKDLILGTD